MTCTPSKSQFTNGTTSEKTLSNNDFNKHWNPLNVITLGQKKLITLTE